MLPRSVGLEVPKATDVGTQPTARGSAVPSNPTILQFYDLQGPPSVVLPFSDDSVITEPTRGATKHTAAHLYEQITIRCAEPV